MPSQDGAAMAAEGARGCGVAISFAALLVKVTARMREGGKAVDRDALDNRGRQGGRFAGASAGENEDRAGCAAASACGLVRVAAGNSRRGADGGTGCCAGWPARFSPAVVIRKRIE